jgi:NAD(P)-dependent dehydrogenase (short-subunit alcohol dehydrogenase family)
MAMGRVEGKVALVAGAGGGIGGAGAEGLAREGAGVVCADIDAAAAETAAARIRAVGGCSTAPGSVMAGHFSTSITASGNA